jgi:hypothetical protein
VAADEKGEEPEQMEQEGDHRARIFSESKPTDQPLGHRPEFGEGQQPGERERITDVDLGDGRGVATGRSSSARVIRLARAWRQGSRNGVPAA